MCFYARTDFKCGDWRWGNMKQRCPRQPRIGETCGAKLPDTDNLTRVDDLCRVCQEKAVKERRLQREKDNIKRWSQEGNKFQASIERAHREVRLLEDTIADLESRRTSKTFNKAPGWRDPGSMATTTSSPHSSLPHRQRNQ